MKFKKMSVASNFLLRPGKILANHKKNKINSLISRLLLANLKGKNHAILWLFLQKKKN